MALRNRRLAQLALFAALATLHTWPLARDPAHLSRLDNDDTAFNTWVVAWVAHQLPRDPAHLFSAPIFHPAPDALAFSEHMVVPAIIGAPLQWAGLSPVLVYNLLVWLGFALSGFAMAVTMERWTGSAFAGIVAGCLYSFNAHQLVRFAHLAGAAHAVLSDRACRVRSRCSPARARAPRRCWRRCSSSRRCARTTRWCSSRRRSSSRCFVRPEPWRSASARMWGQLAGSPESSSIVILVPFLLPYYRVRTEQGPGPDHRRRAASIPRAGSTTWSRRDGSTTPLWSHTVFANRTALFPGITATVLAIVAVGSGIAWRDRRARMALAFGVGRLCPVVRRVAARLRDAARLHPASPGVRAAARWGTLFLIAIAILAGFAVGAARGTVESRQVVVDGAGHRHRRARHRRSAARAAQPGALRRHPVGPPPPRPGRGHRHRRVPALRRRAVQWQWAISARPDATLAADGQRLQQLCARELLPARSSGFSHSPPPETIQPSFARST